MIRSLLKHQKHARKLIKYVIANGEGTLLWYDIWCIEAPLLEDATAVQSLNLHLDSKMSDLIDGENWNDLVLNLPESEPKSSILATTINNLLDKDVIVWQPTASCKFTSKSAHTSLCRLGERFRWCSVI